MQSSRSRLPPNLRTNRGDIQDLNERANLIKIINSRENTLKKRKELSDEYNEIMRRLFKSQQKKKARLRAGRGSIRGSRSREIRDSERFKRGERRTEGKDEAEIIGEEIKKDSMGNLQITYRDYEKERLEKERLDRIRLQEIQLRLDEKKIDRDIELKKLEYLDVQMRQGMQFNQSLYNLNRRFDDAERNVRDLLQGAPAPSYSDAIRMGDRVSEVSSEEEERFVQDDDEVIFEDDTPTAESPRPPPPTPPATLADGTPLTSPSVPQLRSASGGFAPSDDAALQTEARIYTADLTPVKEIRQPEGKARSFKEDIEVSRQYGVTVPEDGTPERTIFDNTLVAGGGLKAVQNIDYEKEVKEYLRNQEQAILQNQVDDERLDVDDIRLQIERQAASLKIEVDKAKREELSGNLERLQRIGAGRVEGASRTIAGPVLPAILRDDPLFQEQSEETQQRITEQFAGLTPREQQEELLKVTPRPAPEFDAEFDTATIGDIVAGISEDTVIGKKKKTKVSKKERRKAEKAAAEAQRLMDAPQTSQDRLEEAEQQRNALKAPPNFLDAMDKKKEVVSNPPPKAPPVLELISDLDGLVGKYPEIKKHLAGPYEHSPIPRLPIPKKTEIMNILKDSPEDIELYNKLRAETKKRRDEKGLGSGKALVPSEPQEPQEPKETEAERKERRRLRKLKKKEAKEAAEEPAAEEPQRKVIDYKKGQKVSVFRPGKEGKKGRWTEGKVVNYNPEYSDEISVAPTSGPQELKNISVETVQNRVVPRPTDESLAEQMGHREVLKGSIGFKHPQGGEPGSYEHTTSGSGWEDYGKFAINNNTDAEWRGIPAKGRHFIIGHKALNTGLGPRGTEEFDESLKKFKADTKENSYHHADGASRAPWAMNMTKVIGPKNLENDIKAGLITLEKIENAPVEDEFE